MNMESNNIRHKEFRDGVESALNRAASAARKLGQLTGTPVYVIRDGKIVNLTAEDFPKSDCDEDKK